MSFEIYSKSDAAAILATALSTASLFSGLDEADYETVSGALKLILVKKGEDIFHEGDSGHDMFVFLSGELNSFAAQSDGTQREMFKIEKGSFFGEMSIITHEPRSATITAVEDSILIMFSEKDFYRIIREHPAVGFKILRAIAFVQNQWLGQSSKSYTDLIRWGENARRRAITDEMTGLFNKSFLEESIRERFNNKSMNLRVMSLLMMDLDKIHSVNDRHGPKGGDIVITSAAETIRTSLRPGDIPARLSGDEYSVLLPDTDNEGALKIAERIREAIEKMQIEVPASPLSEETAIISTRTSIGIALAPAHASTPEEFTENADIALRKAKELGRNRVEVFNNGYL